MNWRVQVQITLLEVPKRDGNGPAAYQLQVTFNPGDEASQFKRWVELAKETNKSLSGQTISWQFQEALSNVVVYDG